MASIRLYTVIFVVLAGFTTLQFVLEELLIDEIYGVAMALILTISTIKAAAVASWYMHVIEEPRAIAYLAIAGVLGVIALTAGAAYSVA